MYNWIETTFNVSGGVTQAIAVVLALAVVLLLFALFIFILKRLMGGQTTQNRSRQPRIAVMDSAPVDSRRRLVLVRRDNIEHLILIGGPSDVVVEQNILRNAPLAQQRPGQPAALSGSAPVRAPVAPGPDIPVRPDDLVAQNDAAPSLPEQARPPAPPVSENLAPPPVAAAAQPARDVPSATGAARAPAPSVSRPLEDPPQVSRPAPSAEITRPTVVSEPPIRTTERSSRASELLKAATQNGFSRKLAKDRSEPSKTALEKDVPAKTETAENVQPVAAPSEAAATTLGGNSGSALKAPARPFDPRERPSYGGHSISPPASGPAARAKTALLKPREAEQPQEKIEPVLATAGTQEPSAPTEAAEAPVSAASPAIDPKTQPAETPATEPVPKAEAADVAPSLPAEEAQQAEPEPIPTKEEPVETIEATDEPTAPPVPAEPPVADQNRDITLDMSDLLEDLPQEDAPVSEETVPEEPASEQTERLESTPADARNEKVSSQPQTPLQQSSQTQQQDTAPIIRHRPPEAKKPVEPVKAAPRPTGGIGDKNPIEEEMAKILDELGGQSN